MADDPKKPETGTERESEAHTLHEDTDEDALLLLGGLALLPVILNLHGPSRRRPGS